MRITTATVYARIPIELKAQLDDFAREHGMTLAGALSAIVEKGLIPERKHVEPHFNESGGCRCRCYRCVKVVMEEEGNHFVIAQKCHCPDCNHDCPTEHRIFVASVPR